MERKEEKPISQGQMRRIYGLARKAGMDNDELHALVMGIARKDSIKDLSAYQAKRTVDRLLVLAGVEEKGAPNRATKEQVSLIFGLAKKLGWSEDPTRLRAFLEKRYSVSHPRFLDDKSSRNVIEAMKAMLAGGRGERKKS